MLPTTRPLPMLCPLPLSLPGPFSFGVPLPRLTFIEGSARQEVLAGKAQPLGTQFEEFWGAVLWANLTLSSP